MKRVLKAFAWMVIGLPVLGLAILFGINATDVALSDEAQAALRLPPPPAPSERNGYIDYLALGAPADAPTFETGVAALAVINKKADGKVPDTTVDPRLRDCKRGEFLACAANPALKDALSSHATLIARYRAMRKKPEFVDLQAGLSPDDPLPAYQLLTGGHRLALIYAAREFNAGRRAAAIDELEAEVAFYRTMASGSRSLVSKAIAWAMHDGDALFAAELARKMPASERGLWARLQAMLRAPTKAELDLTTVVSVERAQMVEWMRTRKYARMSDELYQALKAWDATKERPWWDPVAPWLYRPNYSINKYLAQNRITNEVAERPAHEFLAAQADARRRAAELDGPLWKVLIVSPAGTFNYLLGQYDFSDYVGRAHAHAGIVSLVDLQVRLRSAGMSRPADVARALSGPIGAAHPDPFSGKPMQFDAQKMTLGFHCEPKLLTGVARETVVDNAVALRL